MSPLRTLLAFSSLTTASIGSSAVPLPGPFFEPEQPFFQSQFQVTSPADGRSSGGNFVVRGIVIRLGQGHAAVFDQELLRLAAIWEAPPDQPLTTLQTMPQISYVVRGQRVNSAHPEPTGRLLLTSGMHPGVSPEPDRLFQDPRPPAREGDEGRGALPVEFARFEGIELAGDTAVLRYRSGGTAVREWHEARPAAGSIQLIRHFEVSAHAQPLTFAIGTVGWSTWSLQDSGTASVDAGGIGRIEVKTNSPSFTLSQRRGTLIATLAPSADVQRVSIAITHQNGAALAETPPVPTAPSSRRWTDSVTTSVLLNSTEHNGLIVDRMAVPEENPWKRRVRATDLAFLSDNQAAVLTFEGDVWLVDGFANPTSDKGLTWRRFSSGLYEPLAITSVGGVIQVATKNGVVRLHDRDGNGEADWFENFNDQLIQSKTTRSFPLDMAIGPDGSTYITQGGITTPSGIRSGGTGTDHTGAIMKISPDGRSSRVIATRTREPFLTVHPITGVVTATDQQGHYIPSSVVYYVREGDDYGFLDRNPANLAPALTWIPHEQDPSSSSQVWMMGEGMGPWNGRLLHLSYNTGRLFVVTPDLEAPTPQGAVIPLDVRTDIPLLHARMHPRGDAVYLAGFQIWGTRATTHSGLARLRTGTTPVTTALSARSVRDGVILDFNEPLDPESLRPENVNVRLWNYQRSPSYGSGRFNQEGEAGTTPWGIAQAVASRDGKSVFIHLPDLPPAMQLEVRHDFRLAGGTPARGAAFLTIHEPHAVDLMLAGFPAIDMTKQAQAVVQEAEPPPSIAVGQALSENLGCIACHSIDGTTEGKVGSTWLGLYLSTRTFVDGSVDVADEVYLREKILDPMRRRTTTAPVEMPSYRGVLSEQQLESIILYIRSLREAAR